jgi:PglZ domain
MTHLLHTYIAEQLARHLNNHRVVVWYDPRSEFEPFVSELNATLLDDSLLQVIIGGVATALATHDGSLYSLRSRVEPLVGVDEPHAVVLYLPGVSRDQHGSVLMELELAGGRWEPQLRHLARNALRQLYTDGVIDELLDRERVTYEDLVAASAAENAAPPSVLKPLLHGATSETQLASWLANVDLDAAIVAKEASTELAKLVTARLGFELPDGDLPKWRAITARFVLATEFRSDLLGNPPPQLDYLGAVSSDVERNAGSIARILRDTYPNRYPDLADRAERELHLSSASVAPVHLGAIDTFRFEERALLSRCAALVADGEFTHVVEIAAARTSSFWLRQSIERQAQWEAIRLTAELGAAAEDVESDLSGLPSDVAAWVERYASTWYAVDRAQRHLEAWLPKLEDDPDERAVVAVRKRYDAVVTKLAIGFVATLQLSKWAADGQFQQTSIYDDIVRPTRGRVAYFLVDAMRYEMGAELAERLANHGEVTIRPALGVLPSITPTGMAALMPGAAGDYNVGESGGKLMARIGDTTLPDLKARKKYFAANVPSSVDLELSEVQTLSKAKLAKRLGTAERVVVRSQEIDFFGEGGFQARAVMDTVIENLARAVRKLGAVGVERAVITADHGHLYSSEDRDESMRIDAPGGETIDLHRRCWIGRGGATPASCVRVPARSLGNDTDLDFVFPVGIGVFRAGGDLAFHHGGPSLQELVVPVITVRSGRADAEAGHSAALSVTDAPAAITNRIFSVKLSLASLASDMVPVRPVLIADDSQVGAAGMAVGAEFDRSTGIVLLAPGTEAIVGFVLDDDEVSSVKLVILDPATDAELYRSPTALPVRLGVS